MWIDRIVELIPRERLVAIKNISLAEEHLHDHFAAEAGEIDGGRPALPVMPASLIIEGCAQSAGILVGHAEAFREKVVLAKIGSAEIARDAGPGSTLRYTATIVRLDAQGAMTTVAIDLWEHGKLGANSNSQWQRIGQVELMFSHLDQNLAGTKFPEHNFVFGESFKTLLRTSGVGVA